MHDESNIKSSKIEGEKLQDTKNLVPEKDAKFETNIQSHGGIDSLEPHACKFCGRNNFKNAQALIDHISTHSDTNTTYSCTLCPPNKARVFAKKIQLRIHERKVHGENVAHSRGKNAGAEHQTCDVCQYECISRSALEKHILTHTKVRPHSCGECGKKFVQRSHVNYHMKTVHAPLGTERPKHYACLKCGARFATSSTLRKHSRTHTGKA